MLCKPQDSHNPWIKLWGWVRCSVTARRESLRRASVRHQASREGRRNRAARQTRYRESRRESQVEPTDPTPDDSLRSFRALHLGFPSRLKQARERSDLSMRTLSTAAGISVQAWSNSEAGKVVASIPANAWP